jgi:hypothetical protein
MSMEAARPTTIRLCAMVDRFGVVDALWMLARGIWFHLTAW